jgi:hypothetical protein
LTKTKYDDFTPKEKYLSLGSDSKKWNWQEIQSIAKDGIEQFIETRISPLTLVHKAEYLTTGFDDGELLKIEQKMHDNGYTTIAGEVQKDRVEIKTNFWSKLKSMWS